jgi:hypothetical protein
VYVLATKSFKNPFYNFLQITNAIVISVFQFTLLVKRLPENKTSQDTITNMCINIVAYCWFLNIVVSVILMLKKLAISIFNRLRAVKVKPEEIEEERVIYMRKTRSYRESNNFLYEFK